MMEFDNRIQALEGLTEFIKQDKEELNNLNSGGAPSQGMPGPMAAASREFSTPRKMEDGSNVQNLQNLLMRTRREITEKFN
mmetsp:Transcript_1953/g.1417  ORF Transcript_1953/g.1417 Transcript_1953/m.1417 type:complete len:81 (+) Transcript_1953:763-1005(+)